MRKASFFILAAVIGITGCKPAEDKAAKVDVAAEEQAIRAKETGWMEAYNKHDAKGLAGQYEDDASLAANGTALMTDSVGRGLFLGRVHQTAARRRGLARWNSAGVSPARECLVHSLGKRRMA